MKKIFIFIAMISFYSLAFSESKIDGFGNMKWGSSIDNVKGNVIGKISFTDDKKVLISRDGNIEYLYGFFYKEPENEESELKEEAKPQQNITEKSNPDQKTAENTKPDKAENKNETEAKDTKLFYVSVKFPYLSKEEVKKKLEEKYGPATGEDIKDNQGAMVWTSENTTIIMWVDRYEKKPYCMKINYLSIDVAKEINNYHRMIFNSREIEVLKKLSL